ncbi:BTAD domain-containing putative transcriptional regulator [Amycolatopsis sp. NPDC059090]|uniref:BTAD domain-containing putative transcriptional regulator n=1 Tax=Amycolatopsis sp. NPDC059090 TaxID=3346723 RepID=UPI00366EA03A
MPETIVNGEHLDAAASGPGPLRVEILGPLRVSRGGAEIRMGPTRQRALFAVLAIRHDHVVSRSELVNAVWGHDAPTTAEGSVYTYVSGLRRALEPDRPRRAASTLLLSEGSGYRLRLDPDALDVPGFEKLSADAASALADGAADRAIEAAERALALWRGEPLAGLPGPFAATLRDHLGEARLDLLETRASADLLAGRHAEIVAELGTLTARNPLREGMRALLMTALYRCDRQADALDQFRQFRQLVAAELGTQPGPRIVDIHQRILANDLSPAVPPPAAPPRWSTVPRPRAADFVGRDHELTILREAASALSEGFGRLVWLDGEPGIGKSELLTAGLGGLDRAPVQLCWGSGDELAQRFPLQVMLECLGVEPGSPDPRRAKLAELALRLSDGQDPLGGIDNTLGVVDGLVDLVRQMCADGPVALVVDDMHWVDEASLLVWNRLARSVPQLPLLLVGACRPLPRTATLTALRTTVVSESGALVEVGRLAEGAVKNLITKIVAASPGPTLLNLADRAAGNPLYLRELMDSLMRDRAVRVAAGTAEATTWMEVTAPMSLASALTHRLRFLPVGTLAVLRHATLLGTDFRLEDLSVVVARPPDELLPAIEEATIAGVLLTDGDRLSFRHPLIRGALYDGMAQAVRAVLHRQAAERLSDAGAPIDTVARQLTAVPLTADSWAIGWVFQHGERIANRAPDIGVELLRRVLSACDPDDPRCEQFTARLARVLYWLGESPEGEVRSVLASTLDPDLAGEMRWILGCIYYRRGMDRQGVEALREAANAPGVSAVWRARCRALLAGRQAIGLGDRGPAEANAWRAIREAEEVGDVFAKGYALENLWLFRSIDRDHVDGLRLVDEALRSLEITSADHEVDPTSAHLSLSLLDNRVFSLQNLDRLEHADETLRIAKEFVRRHHLPGGLAASTAVNHYWCGRWDAAMAVLAASVDARGLDMAFRGLRESGPMMLLLHGVAALIGTLQDDGEMASAHLAAADEIPMLTSADRESCDFLLIAEALAAERDGRHEASLAALAPIIDERYSPMMLRHQWLPDAVRIGLQLGETTIAKRALDMCETEAAREVYPARAAAAAARCRALVQGDPDATLAVAQYYEKVGRPVEMAQTLEDAAVLLARAGRDGEVCDVADKALRTYGSLGANWAIRRANERIAAAARSA